MFTLVDKKFPADDNFSPGKVLNPGGDLQTGKTVIF